MTALDNKFFEEYKRLESACNGIYSSKRGVSEYINDMERYSAAGIAGVSGWERDCKSLKHLRRVRNLIAHRPSCCSDCKYEDLEALNGFYSRLLKRDDPLSRLKRAGRRNTKRCRQKENAVYFLTAFIITAIFIIAAIVLIAR